MLRKVLIHGAIALVLSILLTCCWTAFLNWSSHRTIHAWEQPKDIEYWRNARYTLFVKERAPSWSVFGTRSPRYYLFIGWNESYGHWFDCTFHADSIDEDAIENYIGRSTVDWTPEGVSFRQESGHVIFFPKKTFIGGR